MVDDLKTPKAHYFYAAFVVFGCLFLGNIAGIVLASINDFSNLEYDKPGGIFLGIIQGVCGAYFSLAATEYLFQSSKTGDFWLCFYVYGLIILMIVSFLELFYIGHSDLGLDWRGASAISSLVAIEVTRRSVKTASR